MIHVQYTRIVTGRLSTFHRRHEESQFIVDLMESQFEIRLLVGILDGFVLSTPRCFSSHGQLVSGFLESSQSVVHFDLDGPSGEVVLFQGN